MSDKVIVIDGGFATQLSVHVGARVDGDPLWSARFNSTDPNAVIETHLDFLKGNVYFNTNYLNTILSVLTTIFLLTCVAGANAILTNTYQASIEGYMKFLHLTEDESTDLIKKTVQLAHIARTKFLKEDGNENLHISKIPWVVASIGPYGAHLHDGSEYSGSYADYVTIKTLQTWHRIRIDAVLETGVDCLAVETIPCRIEAEAILDMMCNEYPDVRFWLSFQCKVVCFIVTHVHVKCVCSPIVFCVCSIYLYVCTINTIFVILHQHLVPPKQTKNTILGQQQYSARRELCRDRELHLGYRQETQDR